MADVMTVEQAARHLQLTADTVRRKARSGDIPAAKVGRRWRFRKTDLDEWLDNDGDLHEPEVDEYFIRLAEERAALNEEPIPWEQVKRELGL